jgi:ABC-type branched-subunit amino acid transport system ATPase component
LIILDEPFVGLADDFVPFIVGRLNQMRQQHNILLVTNDHIKISTEMAKSKVMHVRLSTEMWPCMP